MKRYVLVIMLLLSAVVVNAQPAEPRPLYALPSVSARVFTSGSIALTVNGRILVAANMLNGTVSIVDLPARRVLAEIPTGDDPRTITLTSNDTRALVVNRADGTLSVINVADEAVEVTHPVGVQPYAVVTNDDSTAYVTLQGTNEVIHLEIDTGRVLQRIPVPATPAGLVLWGDFLYVTHLWSGDVSLIYLPQVSVVRTVSTGLDTALSQAMVIDAGRGLAYLPQSRSNVQNRTLTFDTVVFPVVNVLGLDNLSLRRSDRVTLDTADRPVNMPFAAALDSFRRWLFVVNAGSNDLSIIDLNTGMARANIPVGANPRGVLLSRDNSLAYVHNAIDGSLHIIDTRLFRVTDVLPISDLTIPIDIFLGAQLFHSARDPRMSQDHWISCANCHFDGQSDGRVWQGLPDGARNTPVLYGLMNTAPYTWTGHWDELADLELKIRALQAGDGLIEGSIHPALGQPHAGTSLDLDTLVNYLLTLDQPSAPTPADPLLVEQGRRVFEQLECASCHVGQAGVDGQRHDVGTGGAFVTPTINWLWQSAPYFHDGRAETLYDVFALPGTHQLIGDTSLDDLEALIAYLLSLPD